MMRGRFQATGALGQEPTPAAPPACPHAPPYQKPFPKEYLAILGLLAVGLGLRARRA